MLPYDNRLKQYSQQLRKDMIDAEKALWSNMRGKQNLPLAFFAKEGYSASIQQRDVGRESVLVLRQLS